MITYGLVGAGGMGREMMHLAQETAPSSFPEVSQSDIRFVFVESTPQVREVNGLNVLSYDEFAALNPDETYFNIAVGDGKLREKLANPLVEAGLQPVSSIHETAIIRSSAHIAPGAFLSPWTLVTENVRIGNHFVCFARSQVVHDSVVGDYVTFASAVTTGGNLVVGDYAHIGSGAVLRNGTEDKPLRIGKGTVVGVGAVVVKDVPDGATVVGNPARAIGS